MSGVGLAVSSCPLCDGDGGRLLVRRDDWRVVLAGDPDYPAFTRVIWNAHVAEMSDLRAAERDELMRVVLAVERTQRDLLSPDKVNLASFGNLVAHLHW
ncbi:MAG TPA: HIT domain-containing protein, partial [Burkholderiaceae bacterium]|nr:HIT domain-containing protein [Burkholderiaceae bacterium]